MKIILTVWYFIFLVVALSFINNPSGTTDPLQILSFRMFIIVYPIIMFIALRKKAKYVFFWLIGATLAPYITVLAIPFMFIKQKTLRNNATWFSGNTIIERVEGWSKDTDMNSLAGDSNVDKMFYSGASMASNAGKSVICSTGKIALGGIVGALGMLFSGSLKSSSGSSSGTKSNSKQVDNSNIGHERCFYKAKVLADEKCGSCANWGGPRRVNETRTYCIAAEYSTGICGKASNRNQLFKASSFCYLGVGKGHYSPYGGLR